VAVACLVADTLPPGLDVLAINTGGSPQPRESQLRTFRAMACAHDWHAIVDVSTPVERGVYPHAEGRLAEIRETRRLVRETRATIADAFAVAGTLDELYLTVPTTETNAPTLAAFPDALRVYFPHTFVSLHPREAARYPDGLRGSAGVRGRALDLTKRMVWGRDAVPVRDRSIDVAITFWSEAPWAHENRRLDLVDRAAMERLFAALPADAAGAWRDVAARCGARPAAVLLTDWSPLQPAGQIEIERQGYARMARHMVEQEGATGIIAKPHPRMAADRIDEAVRVMTAVTDVPVEPLTDYRGLPIEVLAAGAGVVAAGGLLSTALVVLPRVFGTKTIYPREAVLQMLDPALVAEILGEWRAMGGEPAAV
jgi:hypothetical protein